MHYLYNLYTGSILSLDLKAYVFMFMKTTKLPPTHTCKLTFQAFSPILKLNASGTTTLGLGASASIGDSETEDLTSTVIRTAACCINCTSVRVRVNACEFTMHLHVCAGNCEYVCLTHANLQWCYDRRYICHED